MHEDVPWQVYGQNGEPITGQGGLRQDFESNSHYGVSASHVWLWRLSYEGVEVLLQKRAATKSTWPSHYDASTAGHIDLGENPLAAAIREAKEELGVDLHPDNLYFVQASRTPIDPREIDFVYTYQYSDEGEFTFGDGEVESVEWWTLESLRYAAQHPDKHALVPQGDSYFDAIIDSLHRQTQI